MITVNVADCHYPPAPKSFPPDAEVFICRAKSDTYDYCGAWAIIGKPNIHKFIIPGSIRADGLFSDPLEAKAALEEYLSHCCS